MPGPSDISIGNVALNMLLSSVLSPASVAANTTAEQTFTINGLIPGDMVAVRKPTTQAGLGIVNSRTSAANTLAIAFINATASPIVPTASETYEILVMRPSNLPRPTAIV